MEEIIINLHMHTTYSDGTGSHEDIARAAIKAGLDAVIVTDHNILVEGVEGYREENGRKVLLLIGEEVHDQALAPQRNHLLVFGADRELATYASSPQRLVDQVSRSGGVCFIAHPNEVALPLFNEDEIGWEAWDVFGYTGMEIWNGLSELKTVIHSRLSAIFYAFFPHFIARSPDKATLKKWDELLNMGRRVVGVGGADAHALHARMGPFSRVIFPYEFHFSAINTHLIIPEPLTGDVPADRMTIRDALRDGHAFIGYDLPQSTRGFRFTIQGHDFNGIQGDEIFLNSSGATLQIRLPARCEVILFKDGEPIRTWNNQEACTYITSKPGIYRVECYLEFLGKRRGWIFSNPIYIRP